MKVGMKITLATLAASGLIAAGCGGDDPDESGAGSPEDAVNSYIAAGQDGDGERVCELLTDDSVKLLEQFGNCDIRPLHECAQRLGVQHGAVDDPVEQVLDAPAVLADQLGTDHPAAALQRVIGTPDGPQCFQLAVIERPAREIAVDRLDGLACLLDEQFEDLRIDAVTGIGNHRAIGRWSRPLRLSCFRCKWRRYDLCGGQVFAAGRCGYFRQRQRIKTAAGVVEHPVRLAPASLDRLHVVLEADDRVSQALER